MTGLKESNSVFSKLDERPEMKRPPLHEIPLDEIMDSLLKAQPSVNVTMNIGQWDGFLQSAYDNGFNLIEVDDYELPVRAFRKIE